MNRDRFVLFFKGAFMNMDRFVLNFKGGIHEQGPFCIVL